MFSNLAISFTAPRLWNDLLPELGTISLPPPPSLPITRGVYPYTRVAQMRHLRNWGERLLGLWGGRTKNIDVLMIVMLKLANGFSDYEQVPGREDRSLLP